MKTLRRIAILATSTVLALGTATVPAQAAPTGWDRCAHTNYCVFADADGQGAMFILTPATGSGTYNFPSWFNDSATSVWNRSARLVRLYQNANCGTALLTSSPYGPPVNLPWDLNDSASSICAYA